MVSMYLIGYICSCDVRTVYYNFLLKGKLMLADGGSVLLCLKTLIPVKKIHLDSK
jgi:hypothetical protein